VLGITALSQSPISALGGASAIISVSGQQATISTGIVGVKSSYLLTGQQINTSVGSVTIDSDQVILLPGQQINTSIGTYAISGDGSMTIVVPEFDINNFFRKPNFIY